MKLIILLISLVLIAGCAKSDDTEFLRKAAIDACISICNSVKDKQDLSNGPCIGNPIPEHPGWVCDVAHSPRQAEDDLPENQCSAFREGSANHFVEVDASCNLIKTS
jgi:hypothetical protein